MPSDSPHRIEPGAVPEGGLADLHTHTFMSDGRLSPPGLVEKAHLRGLRALSITDHDTLDAYPQAMVAARVLGVELIPGVELSALVGGEDVHLLAYGFDLADRALREHLARYRRDRVARAREMVARLNALGLPVTFEQVLAEARGSSVGRPHVARALVEAGLVESLQEAFVQYIANDAPAYVPKNHTPPEEIVRLVHGAGGVCVLAHPGRHVSLNAVDRLLAAGIDGIETVHPSHDEDLERYYGDLARRYGLIQTGGSDYHGFRDEEEMRFGSYGVPYEHVAHALRRAA